MRRSALLAVVLAVVSACGGASSSDGRDTLTVLAATSLRDALETIAPAFESSHGTVDVEVSVGGSSALAAQIDAGGPGDVIVAADEASLVPLVDAGRVTRPAVVARNRVVLVVEGGNPEGIRGVADLARPELAVVLCAPQVPCGRYAAAALEAAGVTVEARSLEGNVSGVVAKVALGEADAGIAYVTDLRPGVDGIPVDLTATYAAAVVRGTDRRVAAEAFVDFLRSPEGQRLLADAGFLPRA